MTFDPYRDGLGITHAVRPVDHYVLLGLPALESDPQRIAAAADLRLQRLQIIAAQGPADWVPQLTHEVLAAKVCLLSPSAKASYDASLRVATPIPAAAPLAPEDEAAHRATAALLPPAALVGRTRWRTEDEPPPIAQAAASSSAEDPEEREERLRQRQRALLLTGVFIAIAAGFLLYVVVTQSPRRRGAAPTAGRSGFQDRSTIAEADPTSGSPESSPPEPPPTTKTKRPVVVRQELQGELNFTPVTARLLGAQKLVTELTQTTIAWKSADGLEWDFLVLRPNVFKVKITYSAPASWDGAEYKLAIDNEAKTFLFRRGTAEFVTDEYFIPVRQNGNHTLRLTLVQPPPSSTEPIVFKGLVLTPTMGRPSDGELTPPN